MLEYGVEYVLSMVPNIRATKLSDVATKLSDRVEVLRFCDEVGRCCNDIE